MTAILSPPLATENTIRKQPANGESSAIELLESERETLAIVQELRTDPEWEMWSLPEGIRGEHHLTLHSLRGEGKLALDPLVFHGRDKKQAVIVTHLGHGLCGHPKIIHGGLLATLLDEAFGIIALPNLPGNVGFTANLNINYRRPCFSNQFVVIRSKLEKLEGRKAYTEASISDLEGNVFVDGTSLFVSPKKKEEDMIKLE
ncbi:uncharacterized protein VTP21DRAFT_8086 [Calcarisporiella thermophila]|uniref:uncharacterized protein n=1 Tax=Calcarisporiella thermophila TaxID=911321 RepID=UPI003743CE6D